MTVQIVSVGRNVGATAMGAERWHAFKCEVSSLFAHVVFDIDGWSNSLQWGAEQTYIVGGVMRDVATSYLKNLADRYGQDAIGVGTIALVGSFKED